MDLKTNEEVKEIVIFLENFLNKYGCDSNREYFCYLKNTFLKHISIINEIGFDMLEILLDDLITSDRIYYNNDAEIIQDIASKFFSVVLFEAHKEIFGNFLVDFCIKRIYLKDERFVIDIYHSQSKEQLESKIDQFGIVPNQYNLFILSNLIQ
ncbi:hypothetical protein E7O54_03835 [Campylobacter coli]|nr:hypothetical protein [Campylobacter coli]